MQSRFETKSVKRGLPIVAGGALVAATILAGCNGREVDETATTTGVLSGTLAISGALDDANGLGLPNATVFLFGPKDRSDEEDEADDALAAVQTDANGRYS